MADPIRMPPRQISTRGKQSPPVRTGWTFSLDASLDDLTDVDTEGRSQGDVLEFDGTEWRAGPPAVPVLHYTHAQVMAANPWVINHQLGFPPAGVHVFDSNGVQLEAELSYPDPANRLVVTFPFGVSLAGTAYLS